MHLLGQGLDHLVGEFVEGIAHHGVALFQQVGAQVGTARHHVLADGGDIGGAELFGQERGVSAEHCRDIRIGQFEVGEAGPQPGTAGGDRLGAEQGAEAAGELIPALPGVIEHEAGGAALRPAQGQFIGNQLAGIQPRVGQFPPLDGFRLEGAQRPVDKAPGALQHGRCLVK